MQVCIRIWEIIFCITSKHMTKKRPISEAFVDEHDDYSSDFEDEEEIRHLEQQEHTLQEDNVTRKHQHDHEYTKNKEEEGQCREGLHDEGKHDGKPSDDDDLSDEEQVQNGQHTSNGEFEQDPITGLPITRTQKELDKALNQKIEFIHMPKQRKPRLSFSDTEHQSYLRGHQKLESETRKKYFASERYRPLANPEMFTGNRNYYLFYEKEEREFMKLETRNMYPLLMGSHLVDKRDRYREKHDFTTEDDKIPSESSTFWSVSEKNLFFESLARFSIHRVDLIKEQLKDKSVSEIMAYYNLLKMETTRYKSNPKKRQKLVSMSQIPISYEMSEEFVQFEESQAMLMQRCDTHFYNRRGRSERKLNFDNEELIDFEKLSDMLKISNMMLPGKLDYGENINEDNIEFSEQSKVNALQFPLETKIILTNLAVNFTKRLILNSVLKSVSEKGLKRSDSKSNNFYQTTISAQHIGSAIQQLDEQNFHTKPIWCRISDQLIKSKTQVIDEDGSEVKVSKLTVKLKTPLFQAWSKAL
ncbi:unnamed protein product [Ambrosiozyma monospora]|uniref:Unnamed protein product n=1 Tax=Ambrosiozyma monospora TaxID=43982 RepID=A0A9W7DDD1_AMBMO|nr:unnamed protein product [Ambrosiozyma monospora]